MIYRIGLVSSAVMVYFEGPDGMIYEYSCGVKHISPDQEATHLPRQFGEERFNGCMWGSTRLLPEQAVGNRAHIEAAAIAAD